VDQKTTDLYENPQTLLSAAKTAAPLHRNGISDIKLKRNKKVVTQLVRRDVPDSIDLLSLSAPTSNVGLTAKPTPPQEMVVKLIGPNFEDGKWYVSDGGKRFAVSMDDEDFKVRVHAREIGFFDGDLYRVEITTTQTIRGNRLSTARSISRVINPINVEKQQAFSEFEQSGEK
jgi:hypothetical protein